MQGDELRPRFDSGIIVGMAMGLCKYVFKYETGRKWLQGSFGKEDDSRVCPRISILETIFEFSRVYNCSEIN